jgi:hypothetical protein
MMPDPFLIDFSIDTIGAELIGRKKFGTADGASLNLWGAWGSCQQYAVRSNRNVESGNACRLAKCVERM